MQTQAEVDRLGYLSCSDDVRTLTEASIICYWSWHFSDLNDEGMKGDVAGVILQLTLGAEFSALSLNGLQILRLSGYDLSQRRQSATPRQTFDARVGSA